MTVRLLKVVEHQVPAQRLVVDRRPASVEPTLVAGAVEVRDWTNDGRCVGRDPDELFVTGAAQRDAAKLCAACPVRLECLSDALDNQVEFGVWGGLTERQRRALLRARPDVTSWRDLLENARNEAEAAQAG